MNDGLRIFLIFYGIFVWLANIIFCVQLAEKKHQDSFAWGLLGAVSPGLAIIAIAGVPFERE